MPEPETTPSRDTVRRSLMVLLGDRYARAGEVTKAAQCYAIAFDGLWPNVDTDGLFDPSVWLDAPKPRVPSAPPLRVSGKLTLQGDGHATQHLNAILTARNPFLDDPGWDGRPIRTDGEWTAPIELTFPQAHLSLGFWVLFFTNASDAPPPVSRGTAWRTGVLAACYRALHWPYEPAPLAITRLWDKNWRPTRHLTLERDYPPPAEPCEECVRMADPWRHVGLVVGLRIDHDELVGPRTDFMPRYPR